MRKFLIALLCCSPLLSQAQSLEEVIRLAQDSTLTAFQSRYEFEYHAQRFARFEALRKPQLELNVTPNYQRMISDPTRNYVYLRNFDRFSTAAQLKLSQKVLNWGGDAYVESLAIWSDQSILDLNFQTEDDGLVGRVRMVAVVLGAQFGPRDTGLL